VGTVDFGENSTGYGFIVSRTRDFIYHPDESFVNEALNISDFDPELNIVEVCETSRFEDEVPYSVLNHIDQKSGRSSWLVLAPMAPTGWWVGIVLDKESILNRTSVVNEERELEVPTGILIESLNFVSAHNVLFTGYIWQKFGNHIPASLIPNKTDDAPGFTLPQADIPYSDDVTEVFRRVEEDGQVIGWYFRANLRQ